MDKNLRVKGDRTPLFNIDLQMFNSGDAVSDGVGMANQPQQVQQQPQQQQMTPQQPEAGEGVYQQQQQPGQVLEGQEPGQQFNTPQQNHAFAEMRVKNKQLEQETQQLKEKLDRMNGIIGNQFGNQGISDVDGYLNHYTEYEKKELERKARYGDSDAIQKLAAETLVNDPRFKQMEQVSNAMLDMIAKQKETDEISQFNNAHNQQLSSYQDIVKLPNANQILDLMQENNLSLTQAYTLANNNTLLNQQAQQVRQEITNTNAGYGHVRPQQPAGQQSFKTVPQDIVAEYRKLFPGITHEEIMKHYKG